MAARKPITMDPSVAAENFARVPAKDMIRRVAAMDPVTWAIKNRWLRNRRFGFTITNEEKKNRRLWRFHRPFQEEYLENLAEIKVTEKSRQCGISEIALTEEGWFCDMFTNVKAVHTFPREPQLELFSSTRATPFFEETDYLRGRLAKPDSMSRKRIGNSFLLFLSSWSSEMGEGFDADMITFDEKDRMRPGVEFAFEEALSASEFGRVRYISTPTIPNRGVDEYYQQSDQRVWMVKCESCGAHQNIRYPDNYMRVKDYPVDAKRLPEDSWVFICRRCKQPRLNRWEGYWKATAAGNKGIAGYHISQADCVWFTATDLMQKQIKYKFPNIWYNYVLGVTYRADGQLVGESDFWECYKRNSGWDFVRERPKGIVRVSVGIDWGKISYLVILGRDQNGKTYILNMQMIPSVFDQPLTDAIEIGKIVRQYSPDIIVGDLGYGKDSNAYMLQQFPGVYYTCWRPAKQSKIIDPIWNETRHQVDIDKTLSLKSACHLFRKHDQVVIPHPDSEEMARCIEHFKNLTLTMEDKDDGSPDATREVIEGVGDDHYADCMSYALVGLERYGSRGNSGVIWV